MNEDFLIAIKICQSIIGLKTSVIDSEINNAVEKTISIYPNIDKEELKKEILSLYSVQVDPYQILEGKERREPWLKEFKTQKDYNWDFWLRYSEYLEKQKKFAPNVIIELDRLTDSILDKLFNPKRSDIKISKKGLVVGQVQSGKTANYTGLICKAADAGFNFIIVLAGIHNNLRSQTQNRLDEGFLGFDTQYERAYSLNKTTKIGVGLIRGFDKAIANSYTTSLENGDFTRNSTNTAGFNFNSPQPILLVIKKNASVLKRLDNWLKTHETNGLITNKSLLIIDDEADNASINTNKKELDPTTINKFICSIIARFSKSAYVGYTATPFANIFIPQNDNDLFPRDFIVNISAPSNYIGPEKVFGTSNEVDENDNELLPIVFPIKDYNDFVPTGHKKDDAKPQFKDIPKSLKDAIKCFIITCSIRIARGHEAKHNSMLIHVSRFQIWQNHIKDLVERYFLFCKQEIESDDSQIIDEFRKIFEEDTETYKSYKSITSEIKKSKYRDIDNHLIIHSWEEIKPLLYKAVQKIDVKSINGSSADSLTYYDNEKNGISVIVIGGDKLSRGLTLEGLSISYFLRASKMYDTLMQMGRWFGYRPGYVDLCRLFTSDDLNEWYRHITIASEELRSDFDYLANINGTPEDYALKVRNHPGQLQITSVSKMRYTNQIQVSWAGRLIETYQLPMDKKIKKANLDETNSFISKLDQYNIKDNNYLWTNISADLICEYFSNFNVAESLKKVDLELICSYIQELNNYGELTSWSVALMNKTTDPGSVYTFNNNIKVGCFDRNRAEDTNWNTYYIRKNHILGSQKDEFIDLEDDILDKALARTKEIKKKWGDKDYPSPEIVRKEFRPKQKPLLIIYPLNPICANVKNFNDNIEPNTITFSNNDDPFIGFAISFPSSNVNIAISYTANQIADFAETELNFDNDNDNIYED